MKKLIVRIIVRVRLLQSQIKRIVNTIYVIIFYNKRFILIDGWFLQCCGNTTQRNFGDELNVYLLEALTGKKVVSASETLFSGSRYLVIGSIIEHYSSADSIIWGSGVTDGNNNHLSAYPKKVCAVRGKMSRDFLEKYGVDCPEVYGDPALLLPLVYTPLVSKKYKYGIIPHICDINNPIIQKFLSENRKEVHLISFANYGDWHSVIDEINACENIISSSLHGLIISDAYKIPNVWIKISDKIAGGEYKYKDYFSGVEREYFPPLILSEESTISDIDVCLAKYQYIRPNMSSLLKSCPFELSSKYINHA